MYKAEALPFLAAQSRSSNKPHFRRSGSGNVCKGFEEAGHQGFRRLCHRTRSNEDEVYMMARLR